MNIVFYDAMADMETLGFIPHWLNEADARPAAEQLNENYSHGGGWRPFDGFELLPDGSIQYPGDPPYRPLAEILFRRERIVFFAHSWIMIVQPDGSFEICRMD